MLPQMVLEIIQGKRVPVSLWVLVGSILGGLLLLALISFCLWKVRGGARPGGGDRELCAAPPPFHPLPLPPAGLLHPQEAPRGAAGTEGAVKGRRGPLEPGTGGKQHVTVPLFGDNQGLGLLPAPPPGLHPLEGDASGQGGGWIVLAWGCRQVRSGPAFGAKEPPGV